MKKFDISEICGKAWQVFTENWLMLVGVYVVIMIIQMAINSLFSTEVTLNNFNPSSDDPMEQLKQIIEQVQVQPGQFLANLIAKILEFGLLVMMFGLIKGKIADFSADSWKQSFMSYVNFIVAHILVSLIVLVGTCCCIIPGLWLASRLMFAPYAIANNPQMTFSEAIKESWEITNGYSLNIILLFFTCFIIVIGGLLCCCVGVLPAAILIDIIYCVAYLTLAPAEEEAPADEVAAE